MGMTIAEKILAAHAEKDVVRPGEFIEANVDMVMVHDGAQPVLRVLEQMGVEKVLDPAKVSIIPDHRVPAATIEVANTIADLREFAKEQGAYFCEVGRGGISHVIMVQKGKVLPGELAIGIDSHSCTYGALGAFSTGVGTTDGAAAMAIGTMWMKVPESIKFVYRGGPSEWVSAKDLILHTIGHIGVDGARYQAMEFAGEVIEGLPMSGRFTMANMAIEAGAKAGIIAPDETTVAYLKGRTDKPYRMYQSDPDARYAAVYEWDVTTLRPQVAVPFSPGNVKPIDEVGEVTFDQAFLGSCTNGWLEDLRVAAKILRGKQVDSNIRLLVIPGSQEVYMQAAREGLLEIFAEAGGAVGYPNCGPCPGAHMGVLGAGERCISSTNRNYRGRMGSTQSETYLASPAVVAATAIRGRLAAPEEVA